MKLNLASKKSDEVKAEVVVNQPLPSNLSTTVQQPTSSNGGSKEFKKIYKYTTNKNIMEITDKGFNLENRNANGELNGMNCKIAIQFSEFDKNFHQTKYCPFYMDSVLWKGLNSMFKSGYFFQKLEESQKTNKPAFIFQGGGIYEGKIYARTLQINASKMKDSCCLIVNYGEGAKSKTGGYVFKEGTKRTSMLIPISLLEFGGILEDVSNRIPTA